MSNSQPGAEINELNSHLWTDREARALVVKLLVRATGSDPRTVRRWLSRPEDVRPVVAYALRAAVRDARLVRLVESLREPESDDHEGALHEAC